MRLLAILLLISGLQPDSATQKINPKDHAVMVRVPAGEFIMGSNEGLGDEAPEHRVRLGEFWIYRTPVTVGQYRAFCNATKRKMPSAPSWGWKEDHPIINVRWEDAKAYADWAGVFLPTEEQWEKAARGRDGRKYPWGNTWDPTRAHLVKGADFGSGGTVAVGKYPRGASPFGALDMVGSVWHWTDSYYTKDHASRPMSDPPRVVRGGSWGETEPEELRTSHRSGDIWKDEFYGFRCVNRPGPPKTLAPESTSK